jgi:hypothetical protein
LVTEHETYQHIFTFPADTLFNVLMSSIRVSTSGVSSIYCIACWTIAVTACEKKEIPMNKRKERRKKKEKGKSQRTFRYYVNKIGKGFTTQVSLDSTFKMMHKLLKT